VKTTLKKEFKPGHATGTPDYKCIRSDDSLSGWSHMDTCCRGKPNKERILQNMDAVILTVLKPKTSCL